MNAEHLNNLQMSIKNWSPCSLYASDEASFKYKCVDIITKIWKEHEGNRLGDFKS